MVVVNEKSRVPPLGELELQRLSQVLDREGVVAAMLIGSHARGTVGPLSDVDVAVWHEPQLGPSGRFQLQLQLVSDAGATLGTDEVDVIMLNHAPPLMRHRAMDGSKRLVERDHGQRVRLETQAILDYLDTAPLRAELGRGMRERIKEGRFGRR